MTTTLPRRVLREIGAAPDPERLLRAVEFVVERLRPDQLILHGSAARGEMTEWSDLDFIAVRSDEAPCDETPNKRQDTPGRATAPGPGGAPRDDAPNKQQDIRRHRWTCERTDVVVDVLVADRARIESKRWRNGTVYAAALLEGRTVFVKDGVEPVRTDAELEGNGPVTALKRQTFSQAEAAKYMSQAREVLTVAERAADDIPFQACKALHEVAELSLKALLIAQGRPVRYTHDLADLWDEVEADGADRIAAERDDRKLQKLLMYATEWKYDRPDDLTPAEDCPELRRLAEDVFNHAERRVRKR